MSILQVDPDGLNVFASVCEQTAGELRHALSAGVSGPPYQATSTAVTGADSNIEAACGALAARGEDLASKVAAAARMYMGDDEASATAMNRVMGVSR